MDGWNHNPRGWEQVPPEQDQSSFPMAYAPTYPSVPLGAGFTSGSSWPALSQVTTPAQSVLNSSAPTVNQGPTRFQKSETSMDTGGDLRRIHRRKPDASIDNVTRRLAIFNAEPNRDYGPGSAPITPVTTRSSAVVRREAVPGGWQGSDPVCGLAYTPPRGVSPNDTSWGFSGAPPVQHGANPQVSSNEALATKFYDNLSGRQIKNGSDAGKWIRITDAWFRNPKLSVEVMIDSSRPAEAFQPSWDKPRVLSQIRQWVEQAPSCKSAAGREGLWVGLDEAIQRCSTRHDEGWLSSDRTCNVTVNMLKSGGDPSRRVLRLTPTGIQRSCGVLAPRPSAAGFQGRSAANSASLDAIASRSQAARLGVSEDKRRSPRTLQPTLLNRNYRVAKQDSYPQRLNRSLTPTMADSRLSGPSRAVSRPLSPQSAGPPMQVSQQPQTFGSSLSPNRANSTVQAGMQLDPLPTSESMTGEELPVLRDPETGELTVNNSYQWS